MKWSHATNSLNQLNQAILDNVDAIECDVILGEDGQPLLAHPPHRTSDVTVRVLLQKVMLSSTDSSGSKTEPWKLQRHLKLDFKEGCAIKPTLEMIHNLSIQNPWNKIIYLNADILPGPGRRHDPPTLPASIFLESCLDYLGRFQMQNSELSFAFSLGFTCNYLCEQGYQEIDVVAMTALVEHYQLASAEVVLALNARLVYKNVSAFDSFLTRYPCKILAWTGSCEPPIDSQIIDQIQNHFSQQEMENRIDFDCDVLENNILYR
jgi:glycerophosphoryl diester phosphodiesterase